VAAFFELQISLTKFEMIDKIKIQNFPGIRNWMTGTKDRLQNQSRDSDDRHTHFWDKRKKL